MQSKHAYPSKQTPLEGGERERERQAPDQRDKTRELQSKIPSAPMQYHPNHSKRRIKEEWEEERNSERESKRETKKKLRERQKGRSWVRAEKKEKGVLLLLLLLQHSRENGGREGAERCKDIGGGEIGEGGREGGREKKRP
jgi:hypothetical protein